MRALAAWIAPGLLLCAYVAADARALCARGLLLPFSTPILAVLVSLSGAAHWPTQEHQVAA